MGGLRALTSEHPDNISREPKSVEIEPPVSRSPSATRGSVNRSRGSGRPYSSREKEPSEERWVSQVQTGDPEGLREMFYAYYPDLCRFASSYVRSESVAQGVVQDVFIDIWERRFTWVIHGSLKAYLYKAVRNKSLNHLRSEEASKRAMETVLDRREDHTGRTAEDVYRYSELKAAIQNAIDEMPSRRRRVFILHRAHGLTYKEIAKIMGIKPKTVENHIGRCLKYLRKEIIGRYV